MQTFCARALSMFLLSMAATVALPAQNVMRIDASAPTAAPQPVAATLGSNRAPDGQTLGVNSQYLTRDGQPWLPVMGELHFSRVPRAEWEDEILKMKAAGVDILSTYIFWIHHEEIEGRFDWSGERDLRQFLAVCAKHHMYVWLRLGPWAHGEARNGGLPDWVLAQGPTRRNDPKYLQSVKLYFDEIGKQAQGMMWKNGGPVIGVQIENEYHDRGPGAGAAHITRLKEMAVAAGMDAPFYTVTGWDGGEVPHGEVLPVYGGYPDAPWDSSPAKMPPSEVYAFRWANRVAGNMGALGGAGQSAATNYAGTPFLTAEVGDGIEDTYFRRPVIAPDDIAAMVPVMLGSGANMLGYYMFHGGRNPEGKRTTLQESQRTGYPTDVPVRSYDFQAPIGESGEERAVLAKIKLVHYFLEDFGSELAPMVPHAPEKQPASTGDTSVPRVGARTLGDKGFLFLNNYVRGLTLPARPGFQVALALPGGVVHVPEEPITLPSGAYGIWPVHLDVGGLRLRYSTAQLVKRVMTAAGAYYFFAAIPGISPELVLDGSPEEAGVRDGVEVSRAGERTRLRMDVSHTAQFTLKTAQGLVHLVVLPATLAEQLWKLDDPHSLLLTAEEAFSDGQTTTLRSAGTPGFAFALLGDGAGTTAASPARLNRGSYDGLFTHYTAAVPAAHLSATSQPVQAAGPDRPFTLGPAFGWRPTPTVMAPEDADFARAAVWRIRVSGSTGAGVEDVRLRIPYQGDVARLYSGTRLLDDNFFNGTPWTLGMKELGLAVGPQDLLLKVLPLPKGAPMYLETPGPLAFGSAGHLDAVHGVAVVPEYQMQFHLAP